MCVCVSDGVWVSVMMNVQVQARPAPSIISSDSSKIRDHLNLELSHLKLDYKIPFSPQPRVMECVCVCVVECSYQRACVGRAYLMREEGSGLGREGLKFIRL